jgi:hypothetical protein
MRVELSAGSSMLQKRAGAALTAAADRVRALEAEAATRIRDHAAENEQLNRRFADSSDAFAALLREERAVVTELRAELAETQQSLVETQQSLALASSSILEAVQTTAGSENGERKALGVVAQADESAAVAVRYRAALLLQHRRGREFRSLLDFFRRWVFVADVKIASQQRHAEAERAAREQAQVEELAALRRELRAVVTASVAIDIERDEP